MPLASAAPSPRAGTGDVTQQHSSTATPTSFTAEEASFADTWRPFKNRAYFAQRAASSKRNKTLKQVLIIERERVEQKLQQQKLEREQNPDQHLPEVVSFMTVDAAPSVIPPKKYCDITGLEGKYVDPKSTLRYHNAEVYEVIKTFQPGVSQAYLSLRGQGVVLR
ncbi:hypothetical protein ACM66B_005650 [Microbotryomycetes sp. NB124-2]